MAPLPPCPFYQRGKCAFGTKCSKSHEGQPKSKSPSFVAGKKKAPSSNASSKSSSKLKSGSASSPLAIDKQPDGLQAPTSAPATGSFSSVSPSPPGRERCSFFPAGMCSDDKCAFLHEDPEAQSAPQPAKTSQAPEQSKLCRHYKKGNCTRGDECFFKHANEEAGEASWTVGDTAGEEPGQPSNAPEETAVEDAPPDVEEETTSDEKLVDWAEEVAIQTEADGTREILDGDIPIDEYTPAGSKEQLEDTCEADQELHGQEQEQPQEYEQEQEEGHEQEQERQRDVGEDVERTPEADDDDMYTEEPPQEEAYDVEDAGVEEYPSDAVPIEQGAQAQGGHQEHHQERYDVSQPPTPPQQTYYVKQRIGPLPIAPSIAPITAYPEPYQEARHASPSPAGSQQTYRVEQTGAAPSISSTTVYAQAYPSAVQQPTVAIPPGLPIPHPSQGFHWTQFADPYAKIDVPCCKMHFRGFCQAGDHCTFRHSLSIQEYSLLFHDPQPSLCTITQPNLRLPGGVLLSTLLTQSAPGTVTAPGPSTPPVLDDTTSAARPKPAQPVECLYYPSGKCRNDPCSFLHIDPSNGSSSNPRLSSEPGRSNHAYKSQNPAGPRMCKYFIDKNACTYGDKCHFRHGEDDPRPAFNRSSAQEPADWAYEAPATTADWTQDENPVTQESTATGEEKTIELDDWKTENDTSGKGWDTQPSNDWGAPSRGSAEQVNDGWDGDWTVSNLPPPPSSGSRDDTSWSRGFGGRDRRSTEKGSGVCFDWKDRGSCSRGARCKFSHDQSQGGTTSRQSGGWASDTTKRRNAVCRMYSTKGRCTWGSNCTFSHDTAGDSQGWNSPAPGSKVGIDESSEDVKLWGGEPTGDEEEEAPGPVVNVKEQTAVEEVEGVPSLVVNGEEQTAVEEVEKSPDSLVTGEDLWEPEAWVQEPPTEPPEDKSKEICKRFASGYCGAGNSCPYIHNLGQSPTSNGVDDLYDGLPATDRERTPDAAKPSEEVSEEVPTTLHSTQEPRQPEPAVKQEPIHFDHPLVQKLLMSCTIRFGFDGRPDLVTVPTQSNTVEILNLPYGTTDDVVRTFAGAWGNINNIRSGAETEDSASFYVEYSDSREASQALRQVSRMEYESRLLHAKMQGRAPLVRRSPSSMTTVKVSWPEPSRSAWVHYNSITRAKHMVAKLDNTNFWDRQISVTFLSPKKNQREKFALHVKNLPLDITTTDLEKLFPEGYAIVVNKPTYETDCTEDIRSIITQCGDIDQFYVDESTASSKTRTAFVAFSLPSNVDIACKLDGVPQDFLGQQPLKVQSVHHVRYRVLDRHYSVVVEAIEELKAQASKKYGLRCRKDPNPEYCLVHLHATKENLPAFVQANKTLRDLLQGVAFQKDGEVFWDDYFAGSSSANALEKLCTNTKFHIERDVLGQRLVIFGQPEERQTAQQQLLKLVQKVRKQYHELDVPRTKVRALLDGNLRRLQFDIGMNKVISLDVASPKLVIRGDSEDLKKVRSLVETLADVETPTDPGATCQICLQVPQVPRQLSCRHYYCDGCLQTALKTKGAAPFQCISHPAAFDGISERCDAPVPYVIIRDVLPPEDHQTFLSASLTSHVQRGEDGLFFCPSIGCEAIYRAEDEGLNLYCPSCASDICTFCQTWAHPGISCSDRKAIEVLP